MQQMLNLMSMENYLDGGKKFM